MQAVEPLASVIRCTICHLDKPPPEFYPSHRGSKTGQCKPCLRERTRARGDARVAQGLPRSYKKSKAKAQVLRKKPPSVSAKSVMQAMTGGAPDPHLEAAMQIVEMQQKTIELLLGRKK